ncbi:MAG: HNH endonuclease family protein [Actinophytocola sp.]|uniref:HNH endonuclease family protein n=1 Tax=Actinophytocola sp. TaxID=1872138 RepID=UPI003C71B0F6
MKARPIVLLAGAATTVALLTGCEELQQALPESAAPAPPAAPAPAGPVSAQLAQLQIQPEDTGAHYDRDDWLTDWAANGECTTRETVLRQQGQGVAVNEECAPTAGTWRSSYDGVTTSNPRDLQIDHIVPLAEAARSGPVVDGRRQRPGDWPPAQRQAYANDIEGLIAVTGSSNQSKSDGDPARWLPSQDPCGYVANWVRVKKKYNLSTDQAEHDAIVAVLAKCPA